MKRIKYLGLIPARKGSKGIINKNLKSLNGKPLIQYTFESAKLSEKLDAVHITTDSEEIIELAKRHGVDALYKRPYELASDIAPMIDTVLYHIKWLSEKQDVEVENIVLLQPTNPIRSKDLIDHCIQAYEEKNNSSMVAVTECLQHPYETFTIQPDGSMKFLFSETPSRRQDYPGFYFVSGALYIASCNFLKEKKKFFDSTSQVWITAPEEGVDIDNIFTFKLAECLMNEVGNKQAGS